MSESWLKAAAAEDVKIWLPSVDYLNSIYEQVRKHGGGTGSISFDTFAGLADKVGIVSVIPAYVGGLAHGFFANLGDTVQAVFGLIKSIFTGEIIEDLKKLWAALSKLTIKDVVDGIGSWAQSWAPRLFSENHFVRGHAWGYFAGYLCAEIAMFALGGAALNALKASKLATKLGQVIARVAPRLTAAVGKVAAVGRASTQALREAKDAVLRRFGQAAAAVGDFAVRAVWKRTAAGKRMLKLFGAAADDMFRPIGGGLVDIYGELKIAGPALDALSVGNVERLQITQNITESMLGRKLDAVAKAAQRQAFSRTLENPAARAKTLSSANQSWDINLRAQQGSFAAKLLSIGKKTDLELPAAVQKASNDLAFSDAAAGAYHAHKHAGELKAATTAATEMQQYLQEARQLIRKGGGKVRHNQSGSRSVVFEDAQRRAIVAISDDGLASIATFGSK